MSSDPKQEKEISRLAEIIRSKREQLTASKASPVNYFRAWTKKAGIEKKIGWHTTRHTFAVLSLEAGTDLYTVSKLLGHTSISTTLGYAKATDGMRREAVERLPEFEIRKG